MFEDELSLMRRYRQFTIYTMDEMQMNDDENEFRLAREKRETIAAYFQI